ncbi:hypothetical protein QCA50_006198 [Cerrena zonata]|uniref:Carboxylic ester hydrolase n=1 Tax=Cerrena zonata TaxID=2478898 RepID=A0AAW0GCP7_9APHY
MFGSKFLEQSSTLFLLSVAAQTTDQRCASFTFESNYTRLIASTFFEARDHVNISTLFQAVDTNALPAFCRVQVEITTNVTADSTALAEVWLPEDWNGRFLTIGNGGFSGSVSVGDLAFMAVNQGFAGVSTDSGHSGTATDASWALGNDNAIMDYTWRAMHLSVATGKEIVQKFYGRSHNKAYYVGCSEGGRQGLKEVQEFPDDFDGAVIGSPANWATHLFSSIVRSNLNVLPTTSSRWISENMWRNVIHPEVLRQCDELDGIKDGVISNPLLCSFRPETLACHQNQDPETCLTISQIETLHKLYSDYYETNQTYIFGGFYPGSENDLSTIFGSESSLLGPHYFQNFIVKLSILLHLLVNHYDEHPFFYSDTTWDISQFDMDTILLADSINPGGQNAVNPDLRKFTARQGKVLHYAGWAEDIISAGNSVHYYETVNSFMRANTNIEMDDFYRLFMVAGLGHCYVSDFGDGANAFGAPLQEMAGMPPLAHDARHNILAALVQWVEDDVAPENITAVHYENNNVTAGISFTRPICKYPASSRYVSGDPNSAESFACISY